MVNLFDVLNSADRRRGLEILVQPAIDAISHLSGQIEGQWGLDSIEGTKNRIDYFIEAVDSYKIGLQRGHDGQDTSNPGSDMYDEGLKLGQSLRNRAKDMGNGLVQRSERDNAKKTYAHVTAALDAIKDELVILSRAYNDPAGTLIGGLSDKNGSLNFQVAILYIKDQIPRMMEQFANSGKIARADGKSPLAYMRRGFADLVEGYTDSAEKNFMAAAYRVKKHLARAAKNAPITPPLSTIWPAVLTAVCNSVADPVNGAAKAIQDSLSTVKAAYAFAHYKR